MRNKSLQIISTQTSYLHFLSSRDLPQDYDDFREILENKLMLVDKSLLIKEVLDDKKTKVVVITRPRRFGKTLNLSMLHYFLAAEVNSVSTQGMFDDFNIAKVGKEYLDSLLTGDIPKKYLAEAKARGSQKVLLIGLAFVKKQFKLKHQLVSIK